MNLAQRPLSLACLVQLGRYACRRRHFRDLKAQAPTAASN